MDRIDQMRVFTKIVERGNLSRAARDLRVTQPTASKALASLEAGLRTQLVLRSTRQVTITEAGRRYYERAKALLEGLDEAQAELSDPGRPTGVLRVHGPVVLGELYLGPAAVAFQTRHPGLRCEVTCLDSYVDLVAEGADLAIRLGVISDPNLVRRKLGVMRRSVVAAPSFLERHGPVRRPEDLAQAPTVRFTGLPMGDRLTLQKGPHTRTVELRPGFLANNAVVLREALLAGLGVGLVIDWLVADDVKAGRLVELPAGWLPPPIDCSAVFPSPRFIPIRARAFVDFFWERLRGVPGVTLADEGAPYLYRPRAPAP